MTVQPSPSSGFQAPSNVSYDMRTGQAVTLAMPVYDPGAVDAEYGPQWHLRYLGDIAKVWQDFTGKAVKVGMFDDGAQGWHWDLAPNYDASNNLNVNGWIVDGSWDRPYHGTACAGLIAAAKNGRGGQGIAYDAKLTAIGSIYSDWSPAYVDGADFWKALTAAAYQYDVVNNSWGGVNVSIATDNSRSTEGSSAALYVKGFAALAELGRGGLGTITVKSAGNSAIDNQGSGEDTSRYTIQVGAYRQVDGVASSYSNCGPNLLISAPSNDRSAMGGTGIVTTDLLGDGDDGINWWDDLADAKPNAAKSDYTNAFGGTSAAGPMVTGVASLMLDANAGLGWRDVRTILAQSAKMPIAFETGPVAYHYSVKDVPRTVLMNERQFEIGGLAGHVNGGGLHYSNDYGYGAVDAYAAARMAEVWSLFGPAKTSANETHAAVQADVGLTAHADASIVSAGRDAQMGFVGTPVRFTFQVGDQVDLEHVDLTLRFSSVATLDAGDSAATRYSSDMSNAQLRLIAPDGTEAFTTQPGQRQGVKGVQEFTFGLSSFQGVESKGTWTLQFATYARSITVDGKPVTLSTDLTVHSLKMDLFGSAPTNDDVYSYTNEFFTMAAIQGEGARRTLVDTNGGTDWINAAAVSKDVVVSLVGGQSSSFGGEKAFTIDRGSVIENAVTGDGNDTLIGNRYNNALYGMRGNDVLNGGMGDDLLSGGTGSNRFVFDAKSGHDTIVDWARSDIIQTVKALKGVGSDGVLTVGANATLLLDGTANGNTVLLADASGAKLQSLGQKDGYYWYAYVADAAADAGRVVREAAVQPGLAAAGLVEQIAAANDNTALFGAQDAGASAHAMTAGFFLYDAMAGSMEGGVQLFA